MRVHVCVAVLAVFVGALLAAPAFGRSTLTHQVNITVTNGNCALALRSVSHRNTIIVFHIINNGTVSHGFDIWRVRSPMIKPGQEGTFKVNFHRPGAYPFACVAPHSTVLKGIFTIRKR
jgi:plastocyanin